MAIVVYYGFPRFREWRSHKHYFDARKNLLEYKKLLYDVEAVKKQNGLDSVVDPGLDEIIALVNELRPSTNALPAMKRFLYGWGGSLTVFTIVYFLDSSTHEANFILGSIIISLIAGGPTVMYLSDKPYKSFLFGGGAGFLIAFIIGIAVT